MNESDIEFTVGLDLSDAERKINKFQSEMRMADAAFERITGQSAAPRTTNPRGLGIENFSPVDASLTNAARKFETAVSLASEKLRMQAERAAARKEYNAAYKVNDAAGMQTASEKFATANQNLKNIADIEKANREEEKKQKEIELQDIKQEEITEETKAQNREYNESYIKLSKLHKLLLSILAVWKAIKSAVQANVDMSARLNEEKGFFSVDSRTVFEANRDKTYAAIHRGAENLGKASPFSASSFDAFVTQMQEIRLKAMRGEGIADDQYVIAMQRLFDNLGIGENASDLLSNGNVNLVDLGVKMLSLLENKGLPALDKMSGVDRDLLSGDMLKIFGKEVVNGVMAHLNKRAITGKQETAIEEMLRQGGNAVSFNDLTTATDSVTQSFTTFKKAIDELKQVLLVDLAPALTTFFDVITKFANWISDRFNLGHFSEDRKGLVTTGAIEQGRNSFWSAFFGGRVADLNQVSSQDTKETIAAQMQIGDMDSYVRRVHANPEQATTSEKFNALLFNTRAAKTSQFGTRLENMAGAYALQRLAGWWKKGQLSTDKYNMMYNEMHGLGDLGSALAKRKVPKNVENYSDFVNYIKYDKELSDIYENYFKEGGLWDIGTSGVSDPASYYQSLFTGGGWLNFLDVFSKNAGKEEFGDMIKKISVGYSDKNRDEIIQYGEVHLKITYDDSNGKPVTQFITTETR